MNAEHAHAAPHVVPIRVLLAVWAALMVLTVATVAVTYVDLGRFNIYVALVIALVKASMVGLYFMHLRYDNLFYGMILVIALGFVTLFIGGTIQDTMAYRDAFVPPPGVSVAE